MNSNYICTDCNQYNTDEDRKLKYHILKTHPATYKYHCDFGDCSYETDTISKYRGHRLYHERNMHAVV